MPRVYKRREGVKERKKISSEQMDQAVQIVLSGQSIRKTSMEFQIPPVTLKRYVKKQRTQVKDDVVRYQGLTCPKRQIFSKSEEELLSKYLSTACRLRYCCVTRKVAGTFAVYYARLHNINYPKIWDEKKIAGYDWFKGFKGRHPDLCNELKEYASTAHNGKLGFNKENVSKFFNQLGIVVQSCNLSNESIWNIDEISLAIVHKPGEAVTLKQTEEKVAGDITVCCAINAQGLTIPPFMIFPRENWHDRLLHRCSPGTAYATHPKGWLTTDIFMQFLNHFKKHVECSPSKRIAILMDNHDSHISLASLNFAEKNGIQFITVPPRTSQCLQPLNRTVFSFLNRYFKLSANEWMASNPGKTVSIYNIAEIFGRAFPLAFAEQNITDSFYVSGIWPLNPGVFSDKDFESGTVVDQPNILGNGLATNHTYSNSFQNGFNTDISDLNSYIDAEYMSTITSQYFV